MFTIIDRPEFTIDVTVPMMGGGEQTLKTTFVGLGEDEFGELSWRDTDQFKHGLRQIVVAFHDVDFGGGDVRDEVRLDGDRDLFEVILSQMNARIALLSAYTLEMTGTAGARRGN